MTATTINVWAKHVNQQDARNAATAAKIKPDAKFKRVNGAYVLGKWKIAKQYSDWALSYDGVGVRSFPLLKTAKEFLDCPLSELNEIVSTIETDRQAARDAATAKRNAEQLREATLNAAQFIDNGTVAWWEWAERKVGCTAADVAEAVALADFDDVFDGLALLLDTSDQSVLDKLDDLLHTYTDKQLHSSCEQERLRQACDAILESAYCQSAAEVDFEAALEDSPFRVTIDDDGLFEAVANVVTMTGAESAEDYQTRLAAFNAVLADAGLQLVECATA